MQAQVQADAAQVRPKLRVALSLMLVILLAAAVAPHPPAQADNPMPWDQHGSRWRGSIVVEMQYEALSSVTHEDGTPVVRHSVNEGATFTDLQPVPNSYWQDSGLTAQGSYTGRIQGDGTKSFYTHAGSDDCPATSEDWGREYRTDSWSANEDFSARTGEEWGVTEGDGRTMFRLLTDEGGRTTFQTWAAALMFTGSQKFFCGETTSLSPQPMSVLSGQALISKPLVDDDPDPRRLFGRTTWTEEETSLDPNATSLFAYTVTYDLRLVSRNALEFTWSMPPQTEDRNRDGRIDEYLKGNRSAYVPESGRYDVRFDACANKGAYYAWRFENASGLVRRHSKQTLCHTRETLEEGQWEATLILTKGSGKILRRTKQIEVRNHLILSIGDSYGSGEGNPDVPGVSCIKGAGGCLKDPKWMHADCHRSAHAASARAAVKLEKADDHTSVTFIHLACSGATLEKGLIGRYSGAEKDGRGNAPQLSQAARIVKGQPVDALVVSIGGNDIGFSSVIKGCLIGNVSCYNDETEILGKTGVLHDVVQTLLSELPGRYFELNRCLTTGSCASGNKAVDGSVTVDPSNVLIVGYPDLTKGQDTSYCDDSASLRADEYEWADKVVLWGKEDVPVFLDEAGGTELEARSDGVNEAIINTRNLFGWIPVTNQYFDFMTHGYCADDASWIRSLTQSYAMQNNEKGGFHPNVKGHKNVASHLVPALETVLTAP